MKRFYRWKLCGFSLLLAGSAYAMENTKILPKGVRSFNIKNVNTSVDQKTNALGSLRPIAEPLAKDFSFRKIIDAEKNPINKMLLQSFLYGKFNENDSLGRFTADMRGNIQVTAGIFSYGLTDKLTLALGVPYYQAKMKVSVGFKASENAQKFINYLNEPTNNQTAKARDVAYKLSNAVQQLNNKLIENGYSEIKDFNRSGIGDITAAGKYLFVENTHLKMANASGLVAPTGYSGDPNILVNVPFGTGSWGIFSTFFADEFLREDLWFNQYLKYSYQLPTQKHVRLKTEEESITVAEDRIRHRMGSRWETGLSIQHEPSYGLVAGLGISYTGKDSDRYYTDNAAAKEALEKDTFERTTYWEAKLGYQSIPAFKRGEIPIPFSLTVEAKRHLSSINTIVKDLYTADFSLYF